MISSSTHHVARKKYEKETKANNSAHLVQYKNFNFKFRTGSSEMTMEERMLSCHTYMYVDCCHAKK